MSKIKIEVHAMIEKEKGSNYLVADDPTVQRYIFSDGSEWNVIPRTEWTEWDEAT